MIVAPFSQRKEVWLAVNAHGVLSAGTAVKARVKWDPSLVTVGIKFHFPFGKSGSWRSSLSDDRRFLWEIRSDRDYGWTTPTFNVAHAQLFHSDVVLFD